MYVRSTYMKNILLLLITVSFFGQKANTQSTSVLHGNKCRAFVSNNGENFRNELQATVVPFSRLNQPESLFSSSIWMGGYDTKDELQVAAYTYTSFWDKGYRPGPLPSETQVSPDTSIAKWDHNFKVYGQDILRHLMDAEDGRVDIQRQSIFAWPAKGNKYYSEYYGINLSEVTVDLAPFADLNGNQKYEPELGEYPHVPELSLNTIPSVLIWSVYNTANFNTWKPERNMKIEIQQTSWSINCVENFLDQTVFISYNLINRGEDLKEFRFAQMVDYELGNDNDNYFGIDTSYKIVYVYNKDNDDENPKSLPVTPKSHYDNNPSVITISMLNQDLSRLMFYNQSSIYHFTPATLEPSSDIGFYHLMDGKWLDGKPLHNGRQGYTTQNIDVTKYAFPGDPLNSTGWTMYDSDLTPHQNIVMADHFETTQGKFLKNSSHRVGFVYTLYSDTTLNNLEKINPSLVNKAEILNAFEEGLPNCSLKEASCDAVYPGDTNKDGVVDYLDAVNILRFLNDTGSTRDHNYSFIGREANDWISKDPNDINAKHADIDGNGIVEILDLEYLEIHDGQKYDCGQQNEYRCEISESSPLYITTTTDTIYDEQKLLNINVHTDIKYPIAGISFELIYDYDIFGIGVSTNIPTLWLRDSVKNVQYDKLTQNGFQVVSYTSTKNDELIKDHPANVLFSSIHIEVHLPDTSDINYTELKICRPIIYYKDRKPDTLQGYSKKLYFSDDVVITSSSDVSEIPLTIYPNPAQDRIFIKTNLDPINEIQIWDIHGRKVNSTDIFANQWLDVSTLANGLYFVTYSYNGEAFTKKLQIVR